MKKSLKYGLIVLLLVLAGMIFYKKMYIPKTTFMLVSPTQGDLNISVNGIGNVSAKDIYSITAQSGGKIVNIFTDEGKWVKKGDLLIEIDGVDLPDQLDIAKATLQKAKFEWVASQNELISQQTQKVLLQKTYQRYAKLNKQGFATQSEYDKAFADLQGMDATILVSKSHINSAKAQIELSQKSMDAIQTKIDNLKVYAPIDGYVIDKEAEVAQNILPTHAILSIVDPKTLWVETKIDERISGAVKVGQQASIVLSSQPQKLYEGIVKRILPVSDPVTLEREVDVAFVTIPKPFYMNEQAEVTIVTHRDRDIRKIPLEVVVHRQEKLGVWVLRKEYAHFQSIERVGQDEKEMGVVGLDAKSQIIVPNKNKKTLKEGMKIH